MRTLLKWGVLALVAALATGANAQTAKKPAAGAFPVGKTPVIQVGQTYTAKTYGNWDLMCVKVAKGPEPCEIGQLVVDGKSNPIADIRIFPLPPGRAAIAGATIVTPLGVLLKDGMVITIDKNAPKQYPFTFCTKIGCIARVGLTGLELQSLRTGKTGKITVVLASNPQNPLTIPMSLKDFATAYAALSKRLIDEQKVKK